MKVDKGNIFFTLTILAFVFLITATSIGYKSDARLVPLLTGLATFILLALIIINEFYPLSFVNKMHIDIMESYMSEESRQIKADEEASRKSLLIFIGWIIGFFIAIFLLGFHIAIAAFTFLFFKVENRLGWGKSFIAMVMVWGAIYLMFEVLMGFSLFKGWFFGEII